jgi:hypothetical protein
VICADRPLSYRRPVLEDTIAGSRFVLPALRLEADGLAAWDQVSQNFVATPRNSGRADRQTTDLATRISTRIRCSLSVFRT